MAIRLRVAFFLLTLSAMAMLTNSYPLFDSASGVAASFSGPVRIGYLSRGKDAAVERSRCKGKIGECIGEEEEGMMDSESNRRTVLAGGRGSYISYGAMKRNTIPCSKRGTSYYACSSHSQANPYTRGCSRITQCARNGR